MKIFSLKNFILLSLTFILFTIVGTLTHESGHMAVAKYYGYETTLHYGSMSWDKGSNATKPWKADFDTIQAIYWRNKIDEDNDIRHSESRRQDSLASKIKERYSQGEYKQESALITIGGPAQTLLTSILGVFILLYRRKSIVQRGMKIGDWLALFLALFSLRFVANLTLSVLSELWKPNGTYFGGDEARLARSLDVHLGTFAVPLFLIGAAIALWVIFKVLPLKNRFTFIISGLVGGISGYLIWLEWLGPVILP
jgi:hypothetical protein